MNAQHTARLQGFISISKGAFISHLRYLMITLEEKLLPTFDVIEQEATARANIDWQEQQHLEREASEDQSFNVGYAHYEAMCNVKQSLLNVYAAWLYHAWEQQLLKSYRHVFLDDQSTVKNKDLSLEKAKEKLFDCAAIEDFSSWEKINELRLLSNTVKHADGNSSDTLKQQRADLFTVNQQTRVYAPLSGNDVIVTLEELKIYCSALTEFWHELDKQLACTASKAAASAT